MNNFRCLITWQFLQNVPMVFWEWWYFCSFWLCKAVRVVSYQRFLSTSVPSEACARESARSIWKDTSSAARDIWKCYLLGILEQKYSWLHSSEQFSWQFLLFYFACWNAPSFSPSWRIAGFFSGHPASIHSLCLVTYWFIIPMAYRLTIYGINNV